MRKYLLLIAVLVIIGAGVVAYPHLRSKTTATTTTTTTKPVPKYSNAPLTGLVDPSGSALTRSALTVKIENTPEALPQWGVDQADVVYEEIVNGGITRLAAIFNSQAPTKVGPVRSVRPTDTQVVWPLGGIFAYSGGAAYARGQYFNGARQVDRRKFGRDGDVPRSQPVRAAQPLRRRAGVVRLQGHSNAPARSLQLPSE